jgi:hypothetical protein
LCRFSISEITAKTELIGDLLLNYLLVLEALNDDQLDWLTTARRSAIAVQKAKQPPVEGAASATRTRISGGTDASLRPAVPSKDKPNVRAFIAAQVQVAPPMVLLISRATAKHREYDVDAPRSTWAK